MKSFYYTIIKACQKMCSYIVYLHSMTTIVIGHQIFSTPASKFVFLRLSIDGFSVKMEKSLKTEKLCHINLIGYDFGCHLQLKPNRIFSYCTGLRYMYVYIYVYVYVYLYVYVYVYVYEYVYVYIYI